MDKNLALETLKSFVEHPTDITVKDAILALHPELTESEDERVRKALLHCCDDWEKGQFSCFSKEDVSAIRAYLEKQKEQKPLSTEETELNSIAFLEQLGYTCIPPEKDEYESFEYGNATGWRRKEQKPAEWSDNFEENIRQLLHDKLTWHSEDGSMSSTVLIDDKTLKDIISGIWFYVGKEALKYPNKELNVIEWSEEDKETLNRIISNYQYFCTELSFKEKLTETEQAVFSKVDKEDLVWLKSLRPQPHWKPSEEQMNYLCAVVNEAKRKHNISVSGYPPTRILESLYNDLKKL